MIRTLACRSLIEPPRGFTLIEMLLALSLCSMVGMLATLMLAGVGAATDSENDMRHTTIARQVAIVRLGSLTRSAAVVLAEDDHRLVLWKGDANGDSKPNLSELRQIAWNAPSSEIRTAEPPVNLDSASDETFELNDDFLIVTGSRVGSASFPEQVTVQHVVQWSVEFDNALIRSARLVKAALTIRSESGDDIATVVSALRVEGDAS